MVHDPDHSKGTHPLALTSFRKLLWVLFFTQNLRVSSASGLMIHVPLTFVSLHFAIMIHSLHRRMMRRLGGKRFHACSLRKRTLARASFPSTYILPVVPCAAVLSVLRWLNTVLAVCKYMSFAKSWQEKGYSSQVETWQVKNILMNDFD